MYKVSEKLKELLNIYKSTYLQNELGITGSYLSSILNKKQTCTLIMAKAILSICFDIAISDKKMNELLETYFEKIKK